ncbi:MAG TPA: GNAT family N-acetyltransferase [Acidimicrobiales bacterium]|nr:GNAT family N-acetyltransferase [Acidimicrobiales bacterium]
MKIEPFDQLSAPEPELRALYDLVVAEHEELWSEDPLQPYDEWRKGMTTPVSWSKAVHWVAWDDDRAQVLADAVLNLSFTETNRDKAGLGVYVHPTVRNQGLARELLRPAVERALEEGRVLLNGGGITDAAASTFSERLGGERKITERKSRMVLADLDRSMLEDWVVRAKERAVGYSMLAWDGPVPEEYLDKFVALTMVMNTAPRDDLEMDDWVHTPERHREGEQRAVDQGFTWWTLVVRHDETDELVGYTEFVFPPYSPEAAWQEATAVDPAHRDKGIGRWLKATNALRLLDEKPAVKYVDTWNAFSNAPMLGINIAMGFEVVKSFSEYQVRTEALRERLG